MEKEEGAREELFLFILASLVTRATPGTREVSDM